MAAASDYMGSKYWLLSVTAAAASEVFIFAADRAKVAVLNHHEQNKRVGRFVQQIRQKSFFASSSEAQQPSLDLLPREDQHAAVLTLVVRDDLFFRRCPIHFMHSVMLFLLTAG